MSYPFVCFGSAYVFQVHIWEKAVASQIGCAYDLVRLEKVNLVFSVPFYILTLSKVGNGGFGVALIAHLGGLDGTQNIHVTRKTNQDTLSLFRLHAPRETMQCWCVIVLAGNWLRPP